MTQPLNTICHFCNDTGVTPEKHICKRCYALARLSQAERDERLSSAPAPAAPTAVTGEQDRTEDTRNWHADSQGAWYPDDDTTPEPTCVYCWRPVAAEGMFCSRECEDMQAEVEAKAIDYDAETLIDPSGRIAECNEDLDCGGSFETCVDGKCIRKQRKGAKAASIATLALTLAFTSQHANAKPAQQLPTTCTVTQSWEDGSQIAQCQDGTLWNYDPDGLGPYCPKTSKRFGSHGWHTQQVTDQAYHDCSREVARRK